MCADVQPLCIVVLWVRAICSNSLPLLPRPRFELGHSLRVPQVSAKRTRPPRPTVVNIGPSTPSLSSPFGASHRCCKFVASAALLCPDFLPWVIESCCHGTSNTLCFSCAEPLLLPTRAPESQLGRLPYDLAVATYLSGHRFFRQTGAEPHTPCIERERVQTDSCHASSLLDPCS